MGGGDCTFIFTNVVKVLIINIIIERIGLYFSTIGIQKSGHIGAKENDEVS